MGDTFNRLYELLSDSGFLTFAGYVVVGIIVGAFVITIFNFIKITIISIKNTTIKNENNAAFGEQISESFNNFLSVIGIVLVVSIFSVPVFLIIRKIFQLLGQLVDWLLV